jgi:hypothetical protein
LIAFVVCLLAPLATAQLPDGLAAFVNKTAADIAASPLQVPQFKSATLDTVEDLGKADGATRYLCWLKTDPNRVGYIAVAGNDKSFQVLAFSATVQSPAYFLKSLQVPQAQQKPLGLARTGGVSAVADVPLVTAGRTSLGADPFEISELAASLSSVLNYWQSKSRILLFGHIGFELPEELDPEYARRLAEDPASIQEPNDPKYLSVRKERDAILTQANIPEGRTSEEKAASGARAHNMTKAMLRRRLLDPASAGERLSVLLRERGDYDGVVPINISLRMRDAVLLQADYLDADVKNLRRNIEVFLKTRGRTAQIETQTSDKMRVDALPAIIVGPQDLAGVTLGYCDIGDERFAYVFFPKTGLPLVKSLAQKEQENRLARGLPPEPNWTEKVDAGVQKLREAQERLRKTREEKGLPYNPPARDIEQEYREGMERSRAASETMMVVEDRHSAPSIDIQKGVHLMRCSSLASWQTLYIAKIEVGPNWGKPANK